MKLVIATVFKSTLTIICKVDNESINFDSLKNYLNGLIYQ